MSLLGEISKNSEALRYHAKTAEIAGQNLAHVNDENYARQRVLAREGVMHSSFGGLQTSGLEAGGLDHARSKLLDNRVISEVGETSSLEARQEILQLLQAAMGETLTNSSVNAGLDEDHDSILAPGSLSRALNDFFNSFHELSVAPKAAIDALINGIAKEEGRNNIRANSIQLGIIEAGIFLRIKGKDYDDRYIEAAKNNTALKKLGEAQDVADAVIFLASDRAKYITGQTLYLDGGYRI